MAHFAKLNGNMVAEVIVVNDAEAPNESEGIAFCKSLYGDDTEWVKCSYTGSIRKQFPGIGYTYDASAEVFIAPQPYSSWTLDANHDWQPPVAKPEGNYEWDEQSQIWKPLSG